MTRTAELREGKGPRPSLAPASYEVSSTVSGIPNPKVHANEYWAVLPYITEALQYTQILWKR